MTRSDVQITPEVANRLALFLRCQIPRGQRTNDATALIVNGERIQGWLDCVEAIESLSQPEKENRFGQPFVPYSESQFPENPQNPKP